MAGSPPSRRRGVAGRLVDAGLLGGVLAGGVFVCVANREHPVTPWPPGTVATSRSAVAHDPLDAASTRNLGLALTRAGDIADGDRVMIFTAGRTRRDTPTAAWLLVRRVAQGRYDEAFGAADALLRRDLGERERERLFRLLIAAAHYDASRPALVARLAEAPWWRLAFIRELAGRADAADTDLVMTALSATDHPPTPLELDAVLTRLVNDKAFADAAREARAFSRPARDPNDLGDIAAPPPFGWSDALGEGASSGLEAGALRVDYDGYAAPRLPERLLALAQGRYTLVWRQRFAGDQVRAFAVAIRCAGAGARLATSGPLEAEPDWRSRSLDFEVPATGCEGQMLSIAPLPGERRSALTAWFARFKLATRK